MREIKFRAWDKACDVMLVPEDANKWVMHGNGCSAIDGVWATDDLILMQYTGLKDKNGVEIYAGDKIRANDKIHAYRHFIADDCDTPRNYQWSYWMECEVIGNILREPRAAK